MAKLGQLLIAANLITENQLKEALNLQKKEGGRLGSKLVKLGYITEEKLVDFLSKQYGVPSINLNNYEIDPQVLKIIPAEMAKKYMIIPVARTGATLTVAMADPSNLFAIDDIKFMTGYNVDVVVASESSILEAIKKYYGGVGDLVKKGDGGRTPGVIETKDFTKTGFDQTMPEEEEEEEDIIEEPTIDVEDVENLIDSALENIETIEEQEEEVVKDVDAPIVKLVNKIIFDAIKMGASDIHIEPYETVLRVRYRIDGVLHNIMNLPIKIKGAVTSRVKIMSKLDIAERRLPQDGRIKLKLGKRKEVDLRVSTLPCLFGEKTVMRILDKSNLQIDLTKLGFEEDQLKDFMEAIEKPYGMVLVTGPTGSGKTTTLYSALNHLNKPGINIMTAEDPVEYNFHGINQVQIKEEIGLTFASALRSFLRQDPDIIMVGEIRDFETAEIAIKAALTGHLVLSTLHTNDAPSTVTRLMNMGIEPFLVSSSVILVLAQRLARKICNNCKTEDKVSEKALLGLGFTEEEVAQGIKVFKGKGCPTCNNTGYKGRIALYEVMPISDELKELILEGASALELKNTAIRLGMKTLRRSGLNKIKQGVTSIEEVLRVTFED